MDGMNKWIGTGNVGMSPDLRYTQGGTAILNFSLACTESWFNKEQNEKQERTEWVRCVIWGKRAEGLSKYIKQGDRLSVSGKLRTNKYQDRDGNDRYSTEVVIEEIVFNGSKQRSDASATHTSDGPRRHAPTRSKQPTKHHTNTEETNDYEQEDAYNGQEVATDPDYGAAQIDAHNADDHIPF